MAKLSHFAVERPTRTSYSGLIVTPQDLGKAIHLDE